MDVSYFGIMRTSSYEDIVKRKAMENTKSNSFDGIRLLGDDAHMMLFRIRGLECRCRMVSTTGGIVECIGVIGERHDGFEFFDVVDANFDLGVLLLAV